MYIFTASSGLLSFTSLALEGPQEIMASKTRDKDECFFKLYGDDQSTKSVTEVSTRRIKSIIEAVRMIFISVWNRNLLQITSLVLCVTEIACLHTRLNATLKDI